MRLINHSKFFHEISLHSVSNLSVIEKEPELLKKIYNFLISELEDFQIAEEDFLSLEHQHKEYALNNPDFDIEALDTGLQLILNYINQVIAQDLEQKTIIASNLQNHIFAEPEQLLIEINNIVANIFASHTSMIGLTSLEESRESYSREDYELMLQSYNHLYNKDRILNSYLRHLGTESTYSKKSTLRNTTYNIFNHLFSLENIKNERFQINLKLIEGIHNCSEGFLIRAISIISTLKTPKSLQEIIAKICYNHVNNFAYKYVSELVKKNIIRVNNEVHYYNLVFITASNLNLGIPLQSVDDPYLDPESEHYKNLIEDVSIKLLAHSNKIYDPFNIFNEVIEAFIEILKEYYLYNHHNESGYTQGEYEQYVTFFARILNVEPNMEAFLQLNDDGVVVDIKWSNVKNLLIKHMIENNYFLLTDNIQSCLINLLSENDLNPDITHLFSQPYFFDSHQEFYNFIKFINFGEINYPLREIAYTHYLRQLQSQFQYEPINSENSESFKSFKYLVIKFSDNEEFLRLIKPVFLNEFADILSNLFEDLSSQDELGNNSLMEAIKIKNHKAILLHLFYLNYLDEEQLKVIFTQTDQVNFNVLMSAMYNYPAIAKELLTYIKDFDLNTRMKIFTQKSTAFEYNCIKSALNHPDIFCLILDIAKDFPDKIKFLANTSYQNTLYIDSNYTLLLDILNQSPALVDPFFKYFQDEGSLEALSPFFTQHNDNSENALIIAAKKDVGLLYKLLEYIDKLPSLVQGTLYAHTDNKNYISFNRNYTALFYAASRYPESVDKFLARIVKTCNTRIQTIMFRSILQYFEQYNEKYSAQEYAKITRHLHIATDMLSLELPIRVYARNEWPQKFISYLESDDEAQRNEFLNEWDNFFITQAEVSTQHDSQSSIETSRSENRFWDSRHDSKKRQLEVEGGNNPKKPSR